MERDLGNIAHLKCQRICHSYLLFISFLLTAYTGTVEFTLWPKPGNEGNQAEFGRDLSYFISVMWQSISALINQKQLQKGESNLLGAVVAFCLDINICGEARRRGRDSNKSSVELISLSWLHQPPPPQSNTPVSHKSVCHRTVAFELAQIYHYCSEIIGFVYLFTLGR